MKANKTLILAISIGAFLGAFTGTVKAETYYYFESTSGLITPTEPSLFTETIVSDIAMQTSSSLLFDITQDSQTIDIDLSSSSVASGDISLSFATSNTDLITTPSNSETGDIRTITLDKGSSTTWEDVVLTITASATGYDNVIATSTVTFTSNCATSIDEDSAAVQKAAALDTIIICDTEGNYLLEDANDLLHITNYQDDANIGATILAGSYKLLNNIDFDISFSINKIYQNAAGDENGSKTEDYPYIKSATVSSVSNNVDWDLDGVVDSNDTTGWIPFGNSSCFTGSIDGNNYTISNLYINASEDQTYMSFLGWVDSGIIKNINMNNVYVSGSMGLGAGIIGFAGRTEISNCHSSGNISSYYNGGLVAYMRSSSLSNSHSSINILNGHFSGGLVGDAGGTITNSYSTGDIQGSHVAAGIVGSLYDSSITISNTYSTGSVFGAFSDTTSHGGLIGWCRGSANINSSYATGKIHGWNAGGLVGLSFQGPINISNSYATGDVFGQNMTGGLLGHISDGGSIVNSYTTGDVFGGYSRGAIAGSFNGSISGSYAINDNRQAWDHNDDNIDNYCSSPFNSSCIPTNIKNNSNWSIDIWSSLETDTPTLKNMPTF